MQYRRHRRSEERRVGKDEFSELAKVQLFYVYFIVEVRPTIQGSSASHVYLRLLLPTGTLQEFDITSPKMNVGGKPQAIQKGGTKWIVISFITLLPWWRWFWSLYPEEGCNLFGQNGGGRTRLRLHLAIPIEKTIQIGIIRR